MTVDQAPADVARRPWWRPEPKPKPRVTVQVAGAAPTPASLPPGAVDQHLLAAQRALAILTMEGMSMTRKRHHAAVSLRIDRHTVDDQRRASQSQRRRLELRSLSSSSAPAVKEVP